MTNATKGKNKLSKTFIPVASSMNDININPNIANQADLGCGSKENFLADRFNTNYYFKLNLI